jgi:hypothetical protein
MINRTSQNTPHPRFSQKYPPHTPHTHTHTRLRSENLEFANKNNSDGLHVVQPRSENIWNCDQKHCILFSRGAKNCGIANQSTGFCSAAQRKFWNCVTKALYLVQPRRDKFWNRDQKHCISFNRAAKKL